MAPHIHGDRDVALLIKEFESYIQEIDPSARSYNVPQLNIINNLYEKLSAFLGATCETVFLQTPYDKPNALVFYWSSIFRNGGILRAAWGGDTTVDLNDWQCMKRLMVLETGSPYHFLPFTMSTSVGGNIAPLVLSLQGGVPSKGLNFVDLSDIGDQISASKFKALLDSIQTHNSKSIELVAANYFNDNLTPDEQRKFEQLSGRLNEIRNLVEMPTIKAWNAMLLAAHSLSKATHFKTLVYLPVYHNGVAIAGAILGYNSPSSLGDNEEFQRISTAIADSFLHKVQFAEARAVPFSSSSRIVRWYPGDALGSKPIWNVDGNDFNKHDDTNEHEDDPTKALYLILEKLKSRVPATTQTAYSGEECPCHQFLRLVRERLPERILVWDAAEVLFWCAYDALRTSLGLPLSGADYRFNTENAAKYLPRSPLRLLAKALVNERELGRLARYRDHYVHSFHAFLFGVSTLLALKSGGMEVKDEDFTTWLYASLWHDVAYGVEKIVDLSNDFIKSLIKGDKSRDIDNGGDSRRDAYEAIPLHPHWGKLLVPHEFSSAFETLVKAATYALAGKSGGPEIRGTVRSWLTRALMDWADHGVVGALLFLYSVSKNPDDQPLKEDSMEAKAAAAIALHNFAKWGWADGIKTAPEFSPEDGDSKDVAHNQKVRNATLNARQWLDRNPSVLLLMLADEAACFGRETTEQAADENKIDRKIVNFSVSWSQSKGRKSRLEFDGTYDPVWESKKPPPYCSMIKMINEMPAADCVITVKLCQ